MTDQSALLNVWTSSGIQRPTVCGSCRQWPVRLWLRVLATTLLLLILASGTAYAQRGLLGTEGPYTPPPERLHFEHFTGADGLPGNIVRAIAQDSTGFLWVGTSNGLARYDGYTFETVPLALDSTEQNLNSIWDLYVDTQGDVWVASLDGGLHRFDPTKGAFVGYRADSTKEGSLYNDRVFGLEEDRQGRLWVATGRGSPDEPGVLQSFEPESGTFTTYEPATAADTLSMWPVALLVDRRGALWIADYGQGLQRLDFDSGTVTRFRHDPNDPKTLQNDRLLVLHEDRFGMIWAGGGEYFGQEPGGGLSRFDPQTETFTQFPAGSSTPGGLQGVTVISIEEDDAGTLWVGTTRGGLHRFDRATETFTAYQRDPLDPNSFGGDSPHALFQDRTGTLWAGTWGQGLDRVNAAASRFRLLGVRPRDPATHGLDDAMTVLEDSEGMVWIGTSTGGLVRYDPRSDVFTQFEANPDDPTALVSGFVRALYEDRAGSLWVGTFFGGLHRFDRATETFRRYLPDADNPSSLSVPSVRSIYEDRQGRFWVGMWGAGGGGSGGLSLMDREAGTFTHYPPVPDDSTAMDNGQITGLLEDGAGRFWVATNGGTYLMDRDAGTFKPASEDFYPDQVHQGPDGTVWFVGYDGLLRLRPDSTELERYETTSDLSLRVTNIETDDDGTLWLAHEHGIERLDPATGDFRVYTPAQGVPITHFNNSVSERGASGVLYFGGTPGVVAFQPGALVQNTMPPAVVLTEFRLDNQPVMVSPDGPLRQPIDTVDRLRLTHNQNDIGFTFAALHFLNAAENRYAYLLEGFDDEWIDAGTQRSATYTNLPPGRYTLRVRAANADGVWNEDGSALPIQITPPWWRTWWAYGFYGLIFAAGVFGIDRIQRRRLIAKEREATRERELAQKREVERAYHELRQAKDRLVQQEKLASLGQLTAGIAHEIKNPLNFVNNFAGLSRELVRDLQNETDPDEIQAMLVDLELNAAKIEEHGRRADSIVRSMMQHARGGSSQLEPVNLNTLVEEYVDLAFHGKRVQLPDLSADVEKDLDAAVGIVDVVAQDIGRVLLNLIGNAFDAVHEQATLENGQYRPAVRLATRRVGSDVEIRVEDNGPGIAEEMRTRIFEPFFTTKPTGTGTGLGLSLSYDIVTQGHDGTLTVESTEGKGSAFIVTLPVSQTAATTSAPSS